MPSAAAVPANRSSSTFEITASLKRDCSARSAPTVSGKTGQRGRDSAEAGQLGFGGLEAKLAANPGHHATQDVAVLQVAGALHSRLHVREERQDLGPRLANAVGRQDRGDCPEDAGLPVDQGAVAVEADPLEPVEIEHGLTLGVVESLTAAGQTRGAVAHLTRIVAADRVNGRGLEVLLKAVQSLAQCGDAGLQALPRGVDDDMGFPRFIFPVAHLLPRRQSVAGDVGLP